MPARTRMSNSLKLSSGKATCHRSSENRPGQRAACEFAHRQLAPAAPGVAVVAGHRQ